MGREPDAIIGLLAKGLENSHRAIWNVSRGRLGQQAFGMQSLELHTIGRKSGRRHSTILTAPIYAPDRMVLVASKGGSSFHPDWYKNLVANPLVDITIEGQTRPYTTRTATSEEKSQLWPLVTNVFPGYGGYQRNTDRDIPLVICVPS
ncbi:nitroreductase family deazaflavin-dependent oxidoreductase [Mycobacteroides abscessus]|uniref:nitroreductase family deazaflavin-dependent oxidoreductase n=1 Tax=Mycobacteroides abscessus TaxID=36809 RepID=UPI001F47E4AF|nr:nitroreductase family deazaflavin-dependent oxidoreductase [Mycobacteroides abscessus]